MSELVMSMNRIVINNHIAHLLARVLVCTFLILLCSMANALEYNYDSLGRLATVVYDNQDSISYNYDSAGNIISTTTTKHQNPSIKITSPNGSETWQAGTSHAIRWNTNGAVGTNVKIELYHGTTNDRVITSSTSNDGAYTWLIPSEITSRADYHIKITSTSNASYSDFSDANFSITTQSAIVLSSISIGGPSQVDEGSTATYTAIASFSDGSQNVVTTYAEWYIWGDTGSNATISGGTLTTAPVTADRLALVAANYTYSGVTKTTTKPVIIKNLATPKSLTALAITGASQLNENSTASYVATASFSDGSSSAVTGSAAWSEDSAYATINAGLLNAQSVNSDSAVIISANYTYLGVTKSSSKSVIIKDNIHNKILVSIDVAGPANVSEKNTASYTSTAIFDDGSSQVVTNQTSWSDNSIYASFSQQSGLIQTFEVSSDISLLIYGVYEYNGVTKSATKTVTINNTIPDETVSIVLQNLWPFGQLSSIAGHGDYLYVNTYDDVVKIIDISDINSPTVSGEIDLAIADYDYVRSLNYDNDYLYITTEKHLHVINVSNKSTPTLTVKYAIISSGGIKAVAMQDNFVYVSYWKPGIKEVARIDISDPVNPSIVSTIRTTHNDPAIRMEAKGDYLYLLYEDTGIDIFDISDIQTIRSVSTLVRPGWYKSFSVDDDASRMSIGEWNNDEIVVVDIEDITNPNVISTSSTNGSPSYLTYKAGYIFFSDYGTGLTIKNSDLSKTVALYSTIEEFPFIVRDNYIFGVNSNGLKILKIVPDLLPTDSDMDGFADYEDAFPTDAGEWKDSDNDGVGNNEDPDDDGDGVPDIIDAFPLDSYEAFDTDGDGIGNNADTDDDNDGILDGDDAFPLDATESVDTDGDGVGNNADTDDDNDGILDINDAFPLDATESVDTDGDGIGNNSDTDDDDDGITDQIESHYGSDPLLDTNMPQPFSDVATENSYYYLPILLLDYYGIAEGCGNGQFCPDQVIQRDTAAIWMVKAKMGAFYSPPGATGTVFGDITTTSFAADYIEDLMNHGATTGCDSAIPPNYCPEQSLTKAQAALMLLKAKYGGGYDPGPATGMVFDDVKAKDFVGNYIEAMHTLGYSEGCSTTPILFCPGDALSFGGFAKMLANTFGLVQ